LAAPHGNVVGVNTQADGATTTSAVLVSVLEAASVGAAASLGGMHFALPWTTVHDSPSLHVPFAKHSLLSVPSVPVPGDVAAGSSPTHAATTNEPTTATPTNKKESFAKMRRRYHAARSARGLTSPWRSVDGRYLVSALRRARSFVAAAAAEAGSDEGGAAYRAAGPASIVFRRAHARRGGQSSKHTRTSKRASRRDTVLHSRDLSSRSVRRAADGRTRTRKLSAPKERSSITLARRSVAAPLASEGY
jgi:hypothetical protein